MGCLSSKTKQKAKERDTLSQEGARETAKERQNAAEDELATRQNTSALQAAGTQSRDGADRLSDSPVAVDPEALEVPVPQHTSAPSSPAENVHNTTAKPAVVTPGSIRSAGKGVHGTTPSKGRDATTPTSPSLAESNRKKKEKKDKKKQHDDDAKHRHRDRKRKKGSKTTPSPRSESASIVLSASQSGGRKSSSPPAEVAHVRPASVPSPLKTRLTSTSGSSLSFEFQSDVTPSVKPAVVQRTPGLSASDGVGSVIVSTSPRSADYASSRGVSGVGAASGSQRGGAVPSSRAALSLVGSHHADMVESAPVPLAAAAADAGAGFSVPSLHPTYDLRDAASVGTSTNASRVPYEPYTDFNVHGDDGDDDRLPPYEWVPRTMPLPSPLRRGDGAGTTSLGDTSRLDQHYETSYGAAPMPSLYTGMAPLSDWRDAAPAPAAPMPSVRFYDPAVDASQGGTPLLVPHTFYPHLPPVQWPSSYGPPTALNNGGAYGPPSGLYRDRETDTSVSVEEEEEDADGNTLAALYSPADHAYGARDVRHRSRAVAAPPSLVDAYVSDDDAAYEDYGAPPAPPQPRISILPSPQTYGPSPMVSADAQAYNGYGGGRSSVGYAAYSGVSAHQYKPVTYLFDNSMDNWVHTRRMPAPQRELYADAADLW